LTTRKGKTDRTDVEMDGDAAESAAVGLDAFAAGESQTTDGALAPPVPGGVQREEGAPRRALEAAQEQPSRPDVRPQLKTRAGYRQTGESLTGPLVAERPSKERRRRQRAHAADADDEKDLPPSVEAPDSPHLAPSGSDASHYSFGGRVTGDEDELKQILSHHSRSSTGRDDTSSTAPKHFVGAVHPGHADPDEVRTSGHESSLGRTSPGVRLPVRPIPLPSCALPAPAAAVRSPEDPAWVGNPDHRHGVARPGSGPVVPNPSFLDGLGSRPATAASYEPHFFEAVQRRIEESCERREPRPISTLAKQIQENVGREESRSASVPFPVRSQAPFVSPLPAPLAPFRDPGPGNGRPAGAPAQSVSEVLSAHTDRRPREARPTSGPAAPQHFFEELRAQYAPPISQQEAARWNNPIGELRPRGGGLPGQYWPGLVETANTTAKLRKALQGQIPPPPFDPVFLDHDHGPGPQVTLPPRRPPSAMSEVQQILSGVGRPVDPARPPQGAIRPLPMYDRTAVPPLLQASPERPDANLGRRRADPRFPPPSPQRDVCDATLPKCRRTEFSPVLDGHLSDVDDFVPLEDEDDVQSVLERHVSASRIVPRPGSQNKTVSRDEDLRLAQTRENATLRYVASGGRRSTPPSETRPVGRAPMSEGAVRPAVASVGMAPEGKSSGPTGPGAEYASTYATRQSDRPTVVSGKP